MKKQRTYTRTFCVLLSVVMLLLTLTVFPAVAENTTEDVNSTLVPIEGVENLTQTSTTTEQEPELLNVTSGSVVIDLGKTYRPIHDDFEITSINAFSTCVQPQSGNVIYANEIGMAQIMLLYYNENNILSVFSCQVEVMDVLGTIDVTRSKVFVEKGQKYILDFGELDVYTINIMNYDTLILRSLANGKAIEVVETGTVNIHYSYYTEDGAVASAICTVDVYENANIASGEYVIQEKTNNHYLTYDMPCQLNCPVKTKNDASRADDYVRWLVVATGDGYYTIRSVETIAWVTVANNSSTEGTQIQLSTSPSVAGARWKILKNKFGRIILTPECAQTQNLVMWIATDRWAGSELSIQNYNGTNNTVISEKGWVIFDDTKYYIDNYYDISLKDSPIVSFIPTANNFVINVYKTYNISFTIHKEASYFEHLSINECTCGLNIACTNSDSHQNHHKNRNKYHTQIDKIYRGSSHILIMWANRVGTAYCIYEEGEHYTYAPLALSEGNRIMFYTLSTNMLYCEALMSVLHCHELTHNMGLPDVYDNPDHDLPHGMQCVMERMFDYEAYDFYLYLTENNGEYYQNAHCTSCQEKLLSASPFLELTD